jgi:hypothetical protein
MVHAVPQSVTPTVPQHHVVQSNAPFFSRPSIYVYQKVRWSFFNLSKEAISLTFIDINIAPRPFLSARGRWPGSSHPSTKSCISGGFSTSASSRQCVYASPLAPTTPCIPICTLTLVGLSTAMTYASANTNVDFPSARRLPPPRSFRCSLAHPN